MLAYLLMASIWSGYSSGRIYAPPGEFASYDECMHAAKRFFYEKTAPDKYPFPYQGDAKFNGGVEFAWHCEGYIR